MNDSAMTYPVQINDGSTVQMTEGERYCVAFLPDGARKMRVAVLDFIGCMIPRKGLRTLVFSARPVAGTLTLDAAQVTSMAPVDKRMPIVVPK